MIITTYHVYHFCNNYLSYLSLLKALSVAPLFHFIHLYTNVLKHFRQIATKAMVRPIRIQNKNTHRSMQPVLYKARESTATFSRPSTWPTVAKDGLVAHIVLTDGKHFTLAVFIFDCLKIMNVACQSQLKTILLEERM